MKILFRTSMNILLNQNDQLYIQVDKTVARVYHITVKGTLIQLEIKMKKHEGYDAPWCKCDGYGPLY